MKDLIRFLPCWICIVVMAPFCCSAHAHQDYWTFSTCEENPSDGDLKPEVAVELKQYGQQFSACLISAVDKACTGDYSVLKQLRNDTAHPVVPFSTKGITIENSSVKSSTGSIPIRIYYPSGCSVTEKLPVVIYFHGGGWAFGSASGTDHIAAGISRTSRSAVISVDYRLTPENPYPAGLEDCGRAIQWARHNAVRYRGDPDLIYLAGDSAGGNLAASSAVRESMGNRNIKGVILYYPAVNLTGSDIGSMKRFAKGYGLDLVFLNKVIRCYIPDPGMRAGCLASPANADARNLPPTLIITAQFDILRDDAKKFAEKLSVAGNRVRYICLRGVTHAYLDSPCCEPDFTLTMKETAGFIRITSGAVSRQGSRENRGRPLKGHCQ